MTVSVVHAKEVVLQVLRRQIEAEDLSVWIGQASGKLEGLVQLIEEQDPHWLPYALRDPQFQRGVRMEIAGLMRGPEANLLVLELLG